MHYRNSAIKRMILLRLKGVSGAISVRQLCDSQISQLRKSSVTVLTTSADYVEILIKRSKTLLMATKFWHREREYTRRRNNVSRIIHQ